MIITFLFLTHTFYSVSAILSNFEPILNPVWVYIFLGEDPGIYTMIGAAVVIISATAYAVLSMKKNIA